MEDASRHDPGIHPRNTTKLNKWIGLLLILAIGLAFPSPNRAMQAKAHGSSAGSAALAARTSSGTLQPYSWNLTSSAGGLTSASEDASEPYLVLFIKPSVAKVGTLVTLHITYHGIGLPILYLSFTPSESVEYAAELPGNCDFREHNPCSEVTFRMLKPGVVTFHAGANGEIWDESCPCLVYGMASDNGPAILLTGDILNLLFVQKMS